MKKTLFTLLAISAITLSATAQQKHFSQDSTQGQAFHHQHKDDFMQALNLTPEQKAELKASNKDFRTQMDSLRKNESITVKESRDRMYTLKQARKAKFESILTPEQKATLKEIKEQRMAQRDSSMDRHLNKMKTTLGLTDDQVAQMQAHRSAMEEKMVSIKEDTTLTREQKHAQLESLRTEGEDGLKKILTPEQLSRFEQLRKARMDKGQGREG